MIAHPITEVKPDFYRITVKIIHEICGQSHLHEQIYMEESPFSAIVLKQTGNILLFENKMDSSINTNSELLYSSRCKHRILLNIGYL